LPAGIAAENYKKKLKKNILKSEHGFTMIETLVGVALLIIVFAGIFACYRLAMKVIGLSKSKTTAVSIANAQIEKIRNLDYESVGTKNASLPFALGDLDMNSSQTVGGNTFDVLTQVKYVSDTADGSGSSDTCNLDYKKADVTVSWGGSYQGSITITTNIAPKNQVQEMQSCQSQPGGVLTVTVFNNSGMLVASPGISIYDADTNNLITSATPISGSHSFLLTPDTYRVEVTKTGYSSARTYSASELAVPDSPNPAVLVGDEVNMSLSIDQASVITVDGISPTGQDNYSDSYDDQSKISESNNIQILSGNLLLSGPLYSLSGYAVSNPISPANLVAWEELIFDDERPAATAINYQILYNDGVNWVLVPDSDLGGNSVGFTLSPVSLAGLSKAAYPQIKIKANLTTSDTSATPKVRSWQVVWTTDTGTPVGGAVFHIQGSKTIGEDSAGKKVLKYSQDKTLDGAGHIEITGLDADTYTLSVDPATGLNLIATDPAAQPINASPGVTMPVKLFLMPQNSFLVLVQDDTSLAPIFSASVRLVDSASGYDQIKFTNQQGQVYFAPLASGTYQMTVSAAGFADYSNTVSVSGAANQIVNIHQNE